MEVVTIDSQVFKELTVKINMIAGFVANIQAKADEEPVDNWVDNYEVCTFLKVSDRTLQRLRTSRQVNFTLIRGKTYYRISEIKRLMDENIIRRNDENLKDLIENHKLYVEQRRDTKSDK
jgi:hypothetical protein